MIAINLLPYRYIPLTQDKYTIVDKEDYKLVKEYSWFALKSRGTFYACRNITNDYGFQLTTSLHNILCTPPEGLQIDHIDGDGLNNRQNNLRIVTYSQNCMNRRKSIGKSSKYKGVSYRKDRSSWISYIRVNSTLIYIGYFHSEVDAAKAYNRVAAIHFGEYAYLNKIDEE